MKQKSLLDPQVKPEVFRVIHIKLCQRKRGVVQNWIRKQQKLGLKTLTWIDTGFQT